MSYPFGMLGSMTAVKLRQWRGIKPVAGPSGVRENRRVHVVEGSQRLARTRHNLDASDLNLAGWRWEWRCARYRIEALRSGNQPFGNVTLTLTPDGRVSRRLRKPLEHLANAPYGRYVLSGSAVFGYR